MVTHAALIMDYQWSAAPLITLDHHLSICHRGVGRGISLQTGPSINHWG